MRHLPTIRKLVLQATPTGRFVKTKDAQWAKLVAMAVDPDFVLVAAFCAIGLLTVLNLLLWFPDIGILIEQSNQF
jgi:hypothetical protein